MGIMSKRSPADRRRLARYGAQAIVALILWSFIASPNTAQTAEEEVVEPSTLSAYNAIADAAPIRGLVQHNTYLVSAEPSIARSTSEVSLPSQATSTSWFAELGTLNGLHGTTTGNKVPTETTSTQPGGAKSEEFKIQKGFVGNDELLTFGAGVVKSSAEHSNRPRGYGYASLGSLSLLPAPGSPEAQPGTYDPESDEAKEVERPPSPGTDDPTAYTPNPKGQMAILSIGSVASTSETFREEEKVVSISVAELNGINIGNRTADGRCTNCITINSLRVEARTESDGTKEGARASWRILLHRACRVAFANDPTTGAAYESVTCLDPNPDAIIEAKSADEGEDAIRDPNARGVRKVKTLDQLNDAFASLAKALNVAEIGIDLRVGTHQENAAVKTPAISSAAARGLVLELRTTAASQVLTDMAANDSVKGLVQVVDGACAPVADTLGGQNIPVKPPVPIPRECATGAQQSASAVRTIKLALGQVRATSQAVLGTGLGGGDPGEIDTGGDTPDFPSFEIPSFDIPTFDIPAGGGGGGQNVFLQSGLQAGPLKLRVDWASVGLKPWAPKDMAKGFFTAGLIAGVWALIRRRLRFG